MYFLPLREMIEVLVSSTTFGFGLFLDAWQTLGLLFSYLNSVAIALMLAGVLYKVVQQDSHNNILLEHNFEFLSVQC